MIPVHPFVRGSLFDAGAATGSMVCEDKLPTLAGYDKMTKSIQKVYKRRKICYNKIPLRIADSMDYQLIVK